MSNGANRTSKAFKSASRQNTESFAFTNLSPTVSRSDSKVEAAAETSLKSDPVRTDSTWRSFSEKVLPVEHALPFDFQFEEARRQGSDTETPKISHRKSKSSTEESFFPVAHNGSITEDRTADTSDSVEPVALARERPRKSVSGSITRFARQSWIAPVRSPSPSPRRRRSFLGSKGTRDDFTKAYHPDQRQSAPGDSDGPLSSTIGSTFSRRPSLLRRKSRQSFDVSAQPPSIISIPSVPSLPKSYSTGKLPSLKHKQSNLSDAPSVPSTTSYDRFHGLRPETPKKKDELWGAFRNLENDFQKFQSRPNTTKTALVRSALLPFLRIHAEYPCILTLRPEDLDRRTVILNKWWVGLLELLNGRHGESVSGNDRPAVLEGALGIMVRPEWVTTPSTAPPRSGKPAPVSLKSRSATSLSSNASEFLTDSVLHNVKNTFTRNLLSQMVYVVQKMATRNVPASVVAFSGKATAYAFFYCDGVASILIRLWGISVEALRLVEASYSSRIKNHDVVADKLYTAFPSCLQPLVFRSATSAAKLLRARPRLPISFASIPWYGPWVNKWAGKDTDLFFVFTKNFADLLCRHLPDDADSTEQMCAPGWIFVQAQLLKVIQSTIDRSPGSHAAEKPLIPQSASADDPRGEADASAAVLPLPNSGLNRSMAENRTIMLLRDTLGSNQVMTKRAQMVFADTFERLLKTGVHRLSLFNHTACFTLCDFLEEAISILDRYQKMSSTIETTFDWDFWFDVCKKMLQSQNTMTEVRTFAFLYAMWSNIIQRDSVRMTLCVDWLLSRVVFRQNFNHWCPMVRGYFMRLLIWKISRPSEADSPSDR